MDRLVLGAVAQDVGRGVGGRDQPAGLRDPVPGRHVGNLVAQDEDPREENETEEHDQDGGDQQPRYQPEHWGPIVEGGGPEND